LWVSIPKKTMRTLLLSACAACLLAPIGALAQSAALSNYTLTAQGEPAHYVVLFGLGKETLDATAKSTIAAAAQEFQRTGAASIAVAGHTDTSGNALRYRAGRLLSLRYRR
jgi:outer membrane protein OmpA-like peptidoglycan-associated protein